MIRSRQQTPAAGLTRVRSAAAGSRGLRGHRTRLPCKPDARQWGSSLGWSWRQPLSKGVL